MDTQRQALKILHTSDWHLGKDLFKKSRIEEHQLFLDWLYDRITTDKIDVLIIAGDIFDSFHPKSHALTMYFDFLEKLSLLKNCHVIIVAGNHDSGKFLDAPKAFLKKDNIHVFGTLDPLPQNNWLHLDFNERGIHSFFALPYFRPFQLPRLQIDWKDDVNGTNDIWDDFDTGILKSLHKCFELFNNDCKIKSSTRTLIGHHLFGHAELAGSEHAISLSGLDSIPLTSIKPYFDLVCLGHIHNYAPLDTNRFAFYSGSPIPFRFSEAKDKYVLVHEFSNNILSTQKCHVPTFRSLFSFKGSLESIKENIRMLPTLKKGNLNSFVEIRVKLSDTGPGITDELRNLIEENKGELLSLGHIRNTDIDQNKNEYIKDSLQLSTLDLFNRFYQEKEGKIPSTELLSLFNEVLEEVQTQYGVEKKDYQPTTLEASELEEEQ